MAVALGAAAVLVGEAVLADDGTTTGAAVVAAGGAGAVTSVGGPGAAVCTLELPPTSDMASAPIPSMATAPKASKIARFFPEEGACAGCSHTGFVRSPGTSLWLALRAAWPEAEMAAFCEPLTDGDEDAAPGGVEGAPTEGHEELAADHAAPEAGCELLVGPEGTGLGTASFGAKPAL